MEQRFSLDAAGKLFGISANAMRARANKSPEKYRVERDNGGKIWLWIDPESLPAPRTRKTSVEGSKFDELKASIDALKEHTEAVIELREKLAAETTRAAVAEARANAAEADREHWRDMALRLVSQRRRWWPWGRA